MSAKYSYNESDNARPNLLSTISHQEEFSPKDITWPVIPLEGENPNILFFVNETH